MTATWKPAATIPGTIWAKPAPHPRCTDGRIVQPKKGQTNLSFTLLATTPALSGCPCRAAIIQECCPAKADWGYGRSAGLGTGPKTQEGRQGEELGTHGGIKEDQDKEAREENKLGQTLEEASTRETEGWGQAGCHLDERGNSGVETAPIVISETTPHVKLSPPPSKPWIPPLSLRYPRVRVSQIYLALFWI